MTSSRETHLVELVDDSGRAIGECRVDEAHQQPGRLHRAFSVLLLAPDGRILLQQRAASKTRFPLRWANSCCGHPAPGQSLTTAANRRLREELGIGPVALTEIGVHVYHAEDPATGRVEFEYDHVLRGDLPTDELLLPDPDEVAEVRWVDRDELEADLSGNPRAYAPWLAGVTSRLLLPTPPGASATPGGPAAPALQRDDDAPER
jgi:isopentenyl-diphosphate Delta-isomerase